MPKDDSFKEFVMDQLAGLGVTARPMFGAHGLYKAGDFFAILFKERLFFKTGPDTRAEYEERGMKPFRPSAKMTLKNYYEVPPEVLDDADELKAWARRSAIQKSKSTSGTAVRKAKKSR